MAIEIGAFAVIGHSPVVSGLTAVIRVLLFDRKIAVIVFIRIHEQNWLVIRSNETPLPSETKEYALVFAIVLQRLAVSS